MPTLKDIALGLLVFYQALAACVAATNTPTDVALVKPSNQSGAYCLSSGGPCYGANRAVDGDIYNCAQPLAPNLPGTQPHSSQSWWFVDLGDIYIVYTVTIYNVNSANPIGDNYQFLSSFTIRVGASTNIDSQEVCYTFYSVISEGGNQTFTCSPRPLVGRYVSIQKFLSSADPLSRPDTMILCEVIVAGESYRDIALDKVANQSGEYLAYDPSRAVDGDINSCAQPLTIDGSPCWWQVDLGDLYTVYNVTIFNVASTDSISGTINLNRNGALVGYAFEPIPDSSCVPEQTTSKDLDSSP